MRVANSDGTAMFDPTLTPRPVSDSWAVWSPDGGRLALVGSLSASAIKGRRTAERVARIYRANHSHARGAGKGPLDLGSGRLDVSPRSDRVEQLDRPAVARDVEPLTRPARRSDEAHVEPVRAVVDSMTGTGLLHVALEQERGDVEIADARKGNGLAPLACKTEKIDSTSSPS
jgi:hypothetical protein